MEIIALLNQKGGVGKTTTAVSMAARLNELGKKTLLVDMDPQCNATDTYRGVSENVNTLYDVLVDGGNIVDSIQHADAGDLVAGDRLLGEAEAKISGIGRENRLKVALDSIKNQYEYVILDCPPNLGILTSNALLCANKVIIPIEANRYALMGLSLLGTTIANVKTYTNNTGIMIDGILFVKAALRTVLAKDVATMLPEVCKQLNTKAYTTNIRNAESVKKSQGARMNIFEYEKTGVDKLIKGPADDYRNFVDEFLGGHK